MPANLHLFSTFDQEDILEAARPHLEGQDKPIVAYLPLASLYAEKWMQLTESMFKGMAQVKTVNAELMSKNEIEKIIRDATLVYIPGGNTYLLNHRLHASGVMPYLQKKIQAGLPLVGFSAGAIVCGENILTSNDLNSVGTSHFEGVKAASFNLLTHYPLDGHGQSLKDEWLGDYHFFHDNPVLLLCDGAYVKVDGRKYVLVRGEAYLFSKNGEKERIVEGLRIPVP